MKNHIVFFSGGLSSFAVAHYLKTEHPNDNIVLYFTDTKWEDEDLYRFIHEVSDKLELPMLVHSMGIDPVQLMIKQKVLFNSRIGNCSTILKMKTAADFIKKGKRPEYEEWVNKQYLKDEQFIENATLYFGISFDEYHRTGAIKENWKPFEVEFPLCKVFLDYDELLTLYDIKKPSLYLKGFTHNNCKGRCVKAGRGHYKLLYNEDRKTFDEIKKIEWMLSKYVAAYHTIKRLRDGDYYDQQIYLMAEHLLKDNEEEMYKWHDSGYAYKPKLHFSDETTVDFPTFIKGIQIREIGRSMDKHNTLDLFNEEIGGCGCFVTYD